jgi:Protein of unknown function (DUF3551)
MMIILQSARKAAFFERWRSAAENCFAFFRRRWRRRNRHPMSISGVEANRENKMRQLSKIYAAPAAALFALAYVAVATPAAAGPSEYCRQDVTSGMRSCSFETLEQCQAMSAGRGGTCYRDPLLTDTSNAYAYQPKHQRSNVVRKPVRQ